MYKAYLAGLSGQQLQFAGLSEDEATAFAIGVYDKAREAYPKSRRQLEDAVEQLADGEWTTVRDAMQARLNQMQAERDELRNELNVLKPILANFTEAQSASGCDHCDGICECPT